MKEYVELIQVLTDNVEEFREPIGKAAAAVRSFGPEVYGLCEAVVLGAADLKAAAVKRYVETHGFTREEAILLTLDQWQQMKESIKTLKGKK